MPLVGDPIDPADYSGALATITTRLDTKDTQVTGILAALVARLEGVNASMPARAGGSVNPASGQASWQAGTFTGTTDSLGQVTINYPSPFGTGLIDCIAVNGDGVAAQFVLSLTSANQSGIVVRCDTLEGTITSAPAVRIDWVPLVSASVRIDWIAIGW